MEKITATLSAPQGITAKLTGQAQISADLNLPTIISPPTYEGEYEFTPTENTQTISINGELASQDIIINPIPDDYARMRWSGNIVTFY